MSRSTSHLLSAAALSAVLSAAALSAGGCQLILGIGGELPLEGGGAGGAGAAGGAGGESGGGLGGLPIPPCDPGEVTACYPGPPGTLGVGPCKGSTTICRDDGTWAPCEGSVVPQPESCATPEDEDCNGAGCTVWIQKVIGNVQGIDVGVDGQGNVVAAALFSGEVDLGDGEQITAKDATDVALLKYDRAGALVWKRVIAAPGQQAIQRIDVDAAGFVVLTGHSYHNLDLGGGAGTIGAGAFVAKLDPDGNTLWARLVQSKLGVPIVSFVAQTSQGDAVVGGNGPDIDFGTGDLVAGDSLGFYVARLDGRTGEVEWAKITHGPQKEALGAIEVGPGGEIFLAGTFESEHLELDGDDLHNPTGEDVPFVARLSPGGSYTGGVVWATSPGTPLIDPNDMALDSQGVPAVAGVFDGEIQLASGTYDAGERPSAFVVRDPASMPGEWSRAYMDEKGTAGASRVAIDTHDAIVVAGVYEGRMDFGLGEAPVADDGFLLKLDAEGKLVWLETYHLGEGTVRSLATGPLEDETVLVGSFYDGIDLGGMHVPGLGGMFVAKMGH